MYFWKNFIPGIKRSRFFCWRTIFFYLGHPLVQFSAESADFAIISSWSSKTSPGRVHVINVPSEYASPSQALTPQPLQPKGLCIAWYLRPINDLLVMPSVVRSHRSIVFVKATNIRCIKRVKIIYIHEFNGITASDIRELQHVGQTLILTSSKKSEIFEHSLLKRYFL